MANRYGFSLSNDTVLYRKIVSDVLAKIPEVEVVGSAHNGKAAISKLATLKPDLLTLDIEMPEMNGIQVLEYIQKNAPHIGAIMLSTLTQEGGAMTMKALELGAFDFIPKPQEGNMLGNQKKIEDAIVPMIRAFRKKPRLAGRIKPLSPVAKPGAQGAALTKRTPVSVRRPIFKSRPTKSEIIAIGISTGGPNALAVMLPMIPKDIGVPILIVQHMPPMFTQSLAHSLAGKCQVEVREAKQGEPIVPDTAYIAPGGKQMKVVAGADGKSRVIKITDAPPENGCKPSVDYLFRSVCLSLCGPGHGGDHDGHGLGRNPGAEDDETKRCHDYRPKRSYLRGLWHAAGSRRNGSCGCRLAIERNCRYDC